jgi:lipoprotein-anchoring transpeptidase ErfK/SrfK
MRSPALSVVCLAVLLASTGAALAITADQIKAAEPGEKFGEGPDPLVAKVQILLDRNGVSPGVIDGCPGENVEKAIAAFETMNELEADGAMDDKVWAALIKTGGPVLMFYTITENDLSGLVEQVPEDYSEMAEIEHVGYSSVEEKLAERFHMSLEFLRLLNPDADFSTGSEIVVADSGQDADADADVARIEVDKKQAQLRAFTAIGDMVAAYPVTVGSDQLPSPSGTHRVLAIVREANYTYQPDENFHQGDNDEPLILPPGPNNPVGGIWIDLSEPTYGLHGTPEPDQIDKTPSHGCVRMTNWDARELAEMVSKGTVVEFIDG